MAVTHPDNAASQRVLEKVGFTFEGTSTYEGETSRLYSIARPG